MEQLNNKNLLNELNELATKNLQLIDELQKTNNITDENKNNFKSDILKLIDKYTKANKNNETETDENETETTNKRKQTDEQITKNELKKQNATYKQQTKEKQKKFQDFSKNIKFEIEQIDNNYILKAFTNKEIVDELKQFVEIAVFNEKLEKENFSNNQLKKALNFAIHTTLKKAYATTLNDKENNKKEKTLNDFKFDYAKLFNNFNEKLLFEYYIIVEENGKKELKRLGTK